MTNFMRQKAMLITMRLRKPAEFKKDPLITAEIAAKYGLTEKEAGRFSRRIMLEGTLDRITSLHGKARAILNKKTSPWWDEGTRICPSTLYQTVLGELNPIKLETDIARDEWLEKYPEYVRTLERIQNGFFNPNEHPSVEVMRMKFGFEIKPQPIPDVEDFRLDMSEEDLALIKQDFLADYQAMQDQAMKKMPADKIVEHVGHLAKMLGGYNPDNPEIATTKRLFGSIIGNVRELVTYLPEFNMSNDPKLAGIIDRIKNELCFDSLGSAKDVVDELKKDEHFLADTLDKAKQILDEVSNFI